MKCPLIIHPGRAEEAPFEIIDVLREAGADISKTVMSHLDRTLSKESVLKVSYKLIDMCLFSRSYL